MINMTGPESGDEHEADWHDAADAVQNVSQFGSKPIGTSEFDEAAHSARLALGDEERLPWLESADDVDYDQPASNTGRTIAFIALAVLLLAAIIGGIYWFSHRGASQTAADGSVIEASKEPYKIAPQNPGGKTFQGTGDSSYKVSEGEKPGANLASGAVAVAPKPGASVPVGAPSSAAGTPAAALGGVGVQVGAFGSSASAEAAWTKLIGQHDVLKGMAHRAVEGKADIGTVHRLQAITPDLRAANALCSKLQAEGLKCQVKR
jgi:SPOR domain